MKRVIVIGAGIVGSCCALLLRRDGHEVVLFDPDEPGSHCSSGNAGNLGGNAHFPSAGWLLKIPGMLLNPQEPLSIVWKDLPQLFPWFTRYLLQSTPTRSRSIAQAAASINSEVHGAFVELLREAAASDLLRWNGRLFAYRSHAALKAEESLMKLKFQAGVDMRVLSGGEAREMEPSLGDAVACAIFTPDAGHVINPLAVVAAVVRAFSARGGKFVRAEVQDFRLEGSQVQAVVTSAGNFAADAVVLAAGVWSSALAKKLQVAVPLVAERGYHAMIAEPGVSMRIPTMWTDRKIAVTPMTGGIRIAGIAEFASRETPPDFRKVTTMVDAAKEMIPRLATESFVPWMGCRPATPDYLPVIGRSLRHRNAVFACGHGHSGVMFGPVTARLVADLVAERSSSIDLAPFSPSRFQ